MQRFTLRPSTPSSLHTRSGRHGSAVGLLLALSLTACGGGGGGSGGGDVPLNEGEFSVDDFEYESSRPVGYHPLGLEEALLSPRDETLALVPLVDGTPTPHWIQEDTAAGHAEDLARGAPFGAASIRSVASGNLDEDAERELVAVEITAGGLGLRVTAADLLPDGTTATRTLHELAAGSWTFADARIGLANVDDDPFDELILTARDTLFETYGEAAWVKVFDDPENGGLELLHHARDFGHHNLWGQPADLDGDARMELLFVLEDATHELPVRVFDRLPGDDHLTLTQQWTYLVDDASSVGSKLAVGDLDGDGRDELLACGSIPASAFPRMELRLWEADEEGALRFVAETALALPPGPSTFPGTWDVATLRGAPAASYSRQERFALLAPFGSTWSLWLGDVYDAEGELVWDFDVLDPEVPQTGQLARLTVGDGDTDDRDELYCAFSSLVASTEVFEQSIVDPQRPAEPTRPASRAFHNTSGTVLGASLIPGDVDGDGLRVASTGRRAVQLADPIPLVLLQAPPTRAGISQNYAGSSTAYSQSASQGQSIGVTTQVTVSFSIGFEAEDPFGAVGASARATFGAGLALSGESSSQRTTVRAFSGDHAADVLVFQGTLVESFEYLVTSGPDPALVGTHITIDLPSDARTYKWTVDFYESALGTQVRLPDELLAHRVGAPESYPTRAGLELELGQQVHWLDEDPATVGQGGGTNLSAVRFTEEQVDTREVTVFAEVEAEFKAGGVTSGGSVGIEHTHAYSISYGTETEFEGVVGDIAEPDDYLDWHYDWGLAVQNYGLVTTDDPLRPVAVLPGVTPFQVVRYWVEPTGSAY